MTRSYVSNDKRHMIVGMQKGGMSVSEIGNIVGRPKSTISRILKRFRISGSVLPASRSGRPKNMSDRDRRKLHRDLSSNRRAPLAELCSNVTSSVGMLTLRKELHELGVNICIAVKKPFLSDIHKAKRLAFAKEHLHWTIDDWSKVIWTDESSFEVGKPSCQIRVWRKAHERYNYNCLAPTFKSGRTSIMVWGAITGSSKSYLVLIPPNRRISKDFVEIVSQGALEHYYWHHDHYEHLILMEDGAPVHGSNIQKDWREQLGLKKLEWPPNSLDLNPIENVWKQVKDQVQQRNRPRNKDEMWTSVNLAWEDIPQENIKKLISTMPTRMRTVIAAQGDSTRW
jgi:transposase